MTTLATTTQLRAAIADAEARYLAPPDTSQALGVAPHLALGRVHEWFHDDGPDPRTWHPPLGLFIALARAALDAAPPGSPVLWIGTRCHPYPHALGARVRTASPDTRLLDRSVFIETPDHAERVLAIEIALRSSACAAVIADGSRLGMPESRRLQLAAATNAALCLLARPPRERAELSAAHTRWLAVPAADTHPNHGQDTPARPDAAGWSVELLRCKGLQPSPEDARAWHVRDDRDTGRTTWTPRDGRPAPELPHRTPHQTTKTPTPTRRPA